MTCTSLGSSPRKGKTCGSQYPVGLALFEADPGKLDVESAKSLAFWQALIKQNQPNGVFIIYKFDQSTPGDPENITQDLNVKGSVKTGRTPEVNDFRVQAATCNLESLYGGFKEGKDVYVLYLMSDETIEGRRIEWGKISPVETRIFSNYVNGKVDAVKEVILQVTQTEDYKEQAFSFTPDFTFKELEAETLISLKWGNVPTNVALEVQIEAYDCNDAEVDDLTIGADGVHMFGAYDRTAGAELTIDSVSVVSGNLYSLTFGAGVRVATNTIEIYYKEPSVTDEQYRNSVRKVLVNP